MARPVFHLLHPRTGVPEFDRLVATMVDNQSITTCERVEISGQVHTTPRTIRATLLHATNETLPAVVRGLAAARGAPIVLSTPHGDLGAPFIRLIEIALQLMLGSLKNRFARSSSASAAEKELVKNLEKIPFSISGGALVESIGGFRA
jgi:hypothetical protein